METIDIEFTRFFVKVVQHGSFSKAAEVLRLPKSTLSKAIKKLEEETKTQLLIRTTRNLTLTASGQIFYDSCLGPILILEEAQKSLYGQDSILTGTVKITAPEDLGSEVIAPLVAEITRKHPSLGFELKYTDDILNLVKEGFDFAVRIGTPKESGLKIKKLGEVVLHLVASSDYLKKQSQILSPKDLLNHECLGLTAISRNQKWLLKKDHKTLNVPIKSRIVTNQMTSLLKLALSGAGIALVPSYLARPYIDQGPLIRVLPEWKSPGLAVSLLATQSSQNSARLKLVSNAIASGVQKILQNNI